MKTRQIIVLLWAFLTLSTTSFGQKKKKVPQDTTATRAWVRSYVQSVLSTPVLQPETPPSDNRPDCVAGLTLVSVVPVEKQLEVTFHSLDVQRIDYEVFQAQKVVFSGNTGQLTSPVFRINYNPPKGQYEVKIKAKNCKSDPKTGIKTIQVAQIENSTPANVVPENVIRTTPPRIIYYNYDDTGEELSAIKLKVERKQDGKLYLSDDGTMPFRSYYAINGATTSQLIQYPVRAGEWIHLVKWVADIDNINADAWRTSVQYAGLKNKKFAQTYECTFYVADGTTTKLDYTQPLWKNEAHRDGLNLTYTPAFTLKNKRYGSETIPNESETQLKNLSWATGTDRYQLLYANEVKDLTNRLGKGITDLQDHELDRAADMLASMTSSAYFAVDYEPHNPQADNWRWNFDSGNFRSVMQKLSQRIYERHKKYFYSWIGKGNRFAFRGKQFELDGWANDTWGNDLDTYLAIHENPTEITHVDLAAPTLTQVGFGYSSTTINGDAAKGNEWVSPKLWYLRALDVLNIQTLITPPNEKLLLFVWPFEDKPADANRSPMTRLKWGQGYIKQVDNRVQYPHNLVRDAIFTYLCNPKHSYTQYWLFGNSYDPYDLLYWSKINGQLSCHSQNAGGFFVSEYTGPDTPPCPTSGKGYIGKDALSVSAMIQAHELFAKGIQDVCDGTQVRDSFEFVQYVRQNAGVTETQTPLHQNDTGEFARAYKYGQPWVQLWKNPKSGKRVLLYQDLYAGAFEEGKFTVIIDGRNITRTTQGNNLYTEIFW